MSEQLELIDSRELARRLSVARGTLWNWIYDGTIPAGFVVRLGGRGSRLRFRADQMGELIEHLQHRRCEPPPEEKE